MEPFGKLLFYSETFTVRLLRAAAAHEQTEYSLMINHRIQQHLHAGSVASAVLTMTWKHLQSGLHSAFSSRWTPFELKRTLLHLPTGAVRVCGFFLSIQQMNSKWIHTSSSHVRLSSLRTTLIDNQGKQKKRNRHLIVDLFCHLVQLF